MTSQYRRLKYSTHKIHLVNDTFANFYSKFHDNTLDDLFYKKLERETINHKLMTRTEDTFRTIHGVDGFYFKSDPSIKCIDKYGKPCIIDALHDLDVMANLAICPYDFVDKKTQIRRTGITVKVKSLTAIKG